MLSNDSLPQPGRFINQIVMDCVSEALEVIGQRMHQGDNVGKRFQPSHQGKALSVQQGPTETFSMEGNMTTCCVRHPETVVGYADGSVGVYSTSMQTKLHATPPLFDEGEAVVALDQVTVVPAPQQDQAQLFVAASSKQLHLFTFSSKVEASRGETPELTGSRRGSAVGLSEVSSECSAQANRTGFVSLCVLPDFFNGRQITEVKLSTCGMFAAAVLDSTEVAVVKFTGLSTICLSKSQIVASMTLDSCAFPASFSTETMPTIPEVAFLTHPVPPSLGYHKESQSCRPLTHTLVIGWVGQNVFTTVSLKDYGSAVEKAYAKAKENAASVSEAPQEMKSKEKATKAEKGKSGQVAQPQPVDPVTTPLPPIDALPQRIRHKLLPQLLSTMVVNQAHDAVAFGCFDGIIQVWKPSQGAIHNFNEARYRAHRNNVHAMLVTSLNFVEQSEGRTLLTAAISIPSVEHHSKVVVYDLKEGRAIHTLAHVSGWSIAIPLPDLPLYVLYGSGKWYVGDLLNQGTMVCEFSGVPQPLSIPEGRSMSEMLLFVKDCASRMCVFGDMFAFGVSKEVVVETETTRAISQTSSKGQGERQTVSAGAGTRTPRTNEAPSAMSGGQSKISSPTEERPGVCLQLQYLSTSDAVFEGYPIIKKQFAGCSVVQLGHVLREVGPPSRDDTQSLARVQLPSLGGYFGPPPTSAPHGAMSQSSFKTGGSDALGRKALLSATTGAGTGSFRGSIHPLSHQRALPEGSSYAEIIRHNIESREAGRGMRQAQFKQQWELLKQRTTS